MTETNQSEFQADLAEASSALRDFANGPARRAADEVGASFERAGERIARALGSAAHGGENAFKRMAKVILEELAKVALERVLSGINAGAGNEGGAKSFAPLQSAAAMPAPNGAVSVHFHLGAGADANAVARHQGQIAASVARAVSYGRRNL